MSGWRKRTIMEMAREADIKFKTDVFRSDFCDGVYEDDLERLVDLARADEREACAKVIESHGPFLANGAMLAEVIRARGQA